MTNKPEWLLVREGLERYHNAQSTPLRANPEEIPKCPWEMNHIPRLMFIFEGEGPFWEFRLKSYRCEFSAVEARNFFHRIGAKIVEHQLKDKTRADHETYESWDYFLVEWTGGRRGA